MESTERIDECQSTPIVASLSANLLRVMTAVTGVLLVARPSLFCHGNDMMFARLTGGLLLSSTLSSISTPCRPWLTSQALMGLLLTVTGWFAEHNTEVLVQSQCLLGAGTLVMVVACLGLMSSFWPPPIDSDEQIPQSVSSWRCCRARCQTPLLGHATLSQALLSDQDSTLTPLLLQVDDTTSRNQETSRIVGTRRLLSLAAPQVFYLYLGCAILLIRLPFSLSIPHFVSTTLGALGRGDYQSARSDILLLFLLGSIDAALDFWCVFLFGYAKERIIRSLRVDTFSSTLRQDMTFFDTHTSGELSSRLSSDCGEMAGDLTWFMRFSIESVVRITGITTYMLIRCPTLGGSALCIVPVVAIVNKIYGNFLKNNAIQVQTALAQANSVAQEAFSCIRTVIAFATEDVEHHKYCEKIEDQYKLKIRELFMSGVYFMAISTFLINTCVQAALLLIGTSLIERGTLTPEILLAFMLYQGQLQNETMNLFNAYSSLIKSSGAGDKVFQVLDRIPPPPGTGNHTVNSHVSSTMSEHIQSTCVQLRDIRFSYPTRPSHHVLKGFDLIIPAGSTLALVGPSGSGKSTVIGLLQRFYDPISGDIFIDNINLKTLDLHRHRRHTIGVVTQDPVLFSGSISSNLLYGCCPNTTMMDDVKAAAKMANAHDFITSFPDGYDTPVGERGVALSGGQKQRVAIARAIIKKPSLLLLDEATSALDAASEQVVQEALDRLLTMNADMTTVIVAHRLRTVRNADSIAYIENGKVVEQGNHEELMTIQNGFYKQMVDRAGDSGTLPDD